MRRLTTFILLVVAAGLAVGLLAAPARALSRAAAQKLLDANKSKLTDTKNAIANAKARESGLSSEIASLDGRLQTLGASVAELRAQIATVEVKLVTTRVELEAQKAELARAQQELEAAKVRLAVQETILEERVVSTYKAGDATYIDVVISAADFSDLVGNLQTMSILVGNDNTIVSTLQLAKAEVALQEQAARKAAAAIQVAATKLENQQASLVELRAAAEAQQAQVMAARQDKAGVLATVETSRKAFEEQKAELEAQNSQMAAIINASSGSGGGGKSTGTMVWPVGSASDITSPFGMRLNPILNLYMPHNGIDIAVPEGTTIVAADGGTVISILGPDQSGGGGNVTIIDHGNGLVTLYMHQSAIWVGVGQVVSKSQGIGAVGSTGNSTGPHLHFEVRLNGVAVNPMNYLP